MAGFSDGVQLGGHGVIKNDPTVVMRVEIDPRYGGRDRAGDPLARRRVRSSTRRAAGRGRKRGAARRDDADPARRASAAALRWRRFAVHRRGRSSAATRSSRRSGSTRSTPTCCSARACRVRSSYSQIAAARASRRCATTRCASTTAATLHYTVWSELSAAAARRAARRERRRCRASTASTSSCPPEITPRTRALAARSPRPRQQLRQGQGDRALARDEPDLHARARRARQAGADRLLLVRSQEGPLRVLRVGVRRARAQGRHPDAPGQRLPRRRVERVQGLRRGARRRRALVGRGVLPGQGLGDIRSDAARARSASSAAVARASARRWPLLRHAALPVVEVGDRVRPVVADRAVQGCRRRVQARGAGRPRRAVAVARGAWPAGDDRGDRLLAAPADQPAADAGAGGAAAGALADRPVLRCRP